MKETLPAPINKEEIVWARYAHVSSLLTYIFAITPFLHLYEGAILSIVVPIFISIFQRKSEYVVEQAVEAGYFQLLLAGMFWAVPELFPYTNAVDSFNIFKLFRFIAYIGIGTIHTITLGWSVISISYGKSYNHFLSPFKSIFTSLKKRKVEKSIVNSKLDDLSQKMYYDVKESIEKKIEIFNKLKLQNSDSNIKQKLNKINISLSKLIDALRNDPSEFINSRHFLNYILDSISTILQKYYELNKIEVKDETIKNSLHKVPSVLDSIGDSIDKYQQKIMEKTVMQLDTEIEVMKKTIDMEFFK
jgi:5-bromo-4-chloroindolyl phosphate hydrolysis protein